MRVTPRLLQQPPDSSRLSNSLFLDDGLALRVGMLEVDVAVP